METHFQRLSITAFLSASLWLTACVNSINQDIPTEGEIPINFSVKIEKASTKVTNNVFEKGDQLGLFAILSGNDITKGRYIDNLKLKSDGDENLIPERNVFYPEGEGVALDFISYYPYQAEGISAGDSKITISVQTNQSKEGNYSASDFLVATKDNVKSSSKDVELKFKHKLTNIKLTITPGKDADIDKMLKDNLQIIATGFCSQAEYDFLEDEFTPTGQCYNITPSGEWKEEDGKLVGKEFIIIPQAVGEEQTLQMEWNGKIYTCTMPEIEETDGNMQYEIEIEATENTSHLLSGIVASIEDWPIPIEKTTDNKAQYTALHLSVLTFKPSNVYHIHSGGKIIAEICKEYLQSDDLTTQAIVSYPIKANETADLSKGTVLQLLDIEEDINEGTLEWDLDDNTFTYDEGDSPRLQQICYDEQGNVLTEQSDEAVNINAIAYTLRDTRDSKDIKQYPIVKIGTQYWMRSNLQATKYRDGTDIEEQTTQGTEAGYFTKDDEEYFYNGYVLEEEGKYLAPDGWRIPSEDDWGMLNEYVEGDVSLLKAGTWTNGSTDNEVQPVSNLGMFNIYPIGIWFNEGINSIDYAIGFWTQKLNRDIPQETIFITGDNNSFVKSATMTNIKEDDEDIYKALSVRCIRE